MKKSILIIALVFILTVISAYAESNISLLDNLGGIKLGDSASSMNEKLSGIRKNKNKSKDEPYEFYYPGTIAGITDSRVQFYLDKNDELAEVLYQFYFSSADGFDLDFAAKQSAKGDGGIYDELYDLLKSTIIEMYGDPADMPSSTIMTVYGKAYDSILNHKEGFAEKTEWLVQDNDKFIKVDLALTYRSDRYDLHSLYLSYKSVTSEEVEAMEN